jgi:hypothetical protein
LTVEKESEGEAKEPQKYRKDGGGSAEAESDPEKPKNGGEHGKGENLFQSIHPGTRFGKKGKQRWEIREKKDRQSEAESQRGEDGESMEWRKGECGGKGDSHKGCGAGGGDGDGQKSGSESSGPALFWAFGGEVA